MATDHCGARHFVPLAVALACMGPLACGKRGGLAGPDGSPTIDVGTGDRGPGSEGGTPSDGGVGDATMVVCPSPVSAPGPLRRLTRFEYNNTVRDLFVNGSRPADSLPADGLTNVAAQMPLSAALVEGYHALAHDFAIQATKDAASVSAILGCDAATAGEEACRRRLIGELVPRIFRRAALPEDDTDLGEVFAAGQQFGGGFAGGVRAVLEVALQAPEFLYRVELGEPIDPARPALARPTPFEMAARLSYLLWGSTPDDPLRTAAAQGRLRTKEDVAIEARRLLADPRAHDVVRYFTFQLLGLHDADYVGTNGLGANPTFSAEIASLILEETRLFIDEVTWQGPGDFRTLLTAPFSFLNGPLASFYGTTGVTGATFRKVDLDPARRGGLLTQASVLASTSRGLSTNPSLRGVRVLEGLLCAQIPPPPPGIGMGPVPASPSMTTRQVYEQIGAQAACSTCHQQFDPVGFAFEHYDAVGLWRDTDNGLPVDATGRLPISDAMGTFDGAIELAGRLAQSGDARSCYVGKWMAFAYGRDVAPEDACSRMLLMDDFARTDGSVRDLLIALTQTEAFLTRPATGP